MFQNMLQLILTVLSEAPCPINRDQVLGQCAIKINGRDGTFARWKNVPVELFDRQLSHGVAYGYIVAGFTSGPNSRMATFSIAPMGLKRLEIDLRIQP